MAERKPDGERHHRTTITIPVRVKRRMQAANIAGHRVCWSEIAAVAFAAKCDELGVFGYSMNPAKRPRPGTMVKNAWELYAAYGGAPRSMPGLGHLEGAMLSRLTELHGAWPALCVMGKTFRLLTKIARLPDRDFYFPFDAREYDDYFAKLPKPHPATGGTHG